MRWAFVLLLVGTMLAHTIASASTDGGEGNTRRQFAERDGAVVEARLSPSSLAADTNACLGDINADEYIEWALAKDAEKRHRNEQRMLDKLERDSR